MGLFWEFSAIAEGESTRAALLESAPSANDIADAIVDTFRMAWGSGPVRIGLEESETDRDDRRAVLQFLADPLLSDHFFNANTGYRAQFRYGWARGHAFNRALIVAIRHEIIATPSEVLCARRRVGRFDDCGEIHVSSEQITVDKFCRHAETRMK